LQPRTFHVRKHVKNLSFAQRWVVQCENRFEECVFSPQPEPRNAKICQNARRAGHLGVCGSRIRPKHPAKTFHDHHETPPKIFRSRGMLVLVNLDDIIILGSTKSLVEKHLKMVVETLCQAGFKISQKKSILKPTQIIQNLGFTVNLEKGQLEVPAQKIGKELGKVLMAEKMTCRKMSSILGQIRSYLVALPFLRWMTQKLLAFSQVAASQGWDHLIRIPKELKKETKDLRQFLEPGLGRPFQQQAKRILHSDSSTWAWGGVGHHPGPNHPRILEGKPHPPHQRKGFDGCSLNNSQFCEKGRNDSIKHRQSGGMFVFKKVGRSKSVFERHFTTPVQTLLGKSNSASNKLGSNGQNVGRPPHQMETGSGRLHIKPRSVSENPILFQERDNTNHRHVLLPRECEI